jgi:hypothetical protein
MADTGLMLVFINYICTHLTSAVGCDDKKRIMSNYELLLSLAMSVYNWYI